MGLFVGIHRKVILGVQVSRSSRRNFASNNAPSLIKVSIVCLFPTLILGTSASDSKCLSNRLSLWFV